MPDTQVTQPVPKITLERKENRNKKSKHLVKAYWTNTRQEFSTSKGLKILMQSQQTSPPHFLLTNSPVPGIVGNNGPIYSIHLPSQLVLLKEKQQIKMISQRHSPTTTALE